MMMEEFTSIRRKHQNLDILKLYFCEFLNKILKLYFCEFLNKILKLYFCEFLNKIF